MFQGELTHTRLGEVGLLDGIYDRANRAEPAASFSDLDLPRLQQDDYFALRAE